VSFTPRAQCGDLDRALERARRLLTSHGATTSGDGDERATAAYSVPLSARRSMIEGAERAMAELEVVSRAPMRVVALGRSGVGKSHVLNQLLRELAGRDAPPPTAEKEERLAETWPRESLTIVSVVAHDEVAEEKAADHLRAVEDGDGGGGTALEEDASAFAPPPPMDARTSSEVYIPRHMRGQAIRGDAAKFSDAAAIRKKKLKEAAKRTNKKGGQKVKPSYVLYKTFHEERAKENEQKEAEARKRATYEEAMKTYEIPIREKPFDPPPVPVDNLLKIHADAPFLLPEGDLMDTTSVACSVSTSDAFRVTLVYFSEDVVKKHVHALDYASDVARAVERLRDSLSVYAESFVRREAEARGVRELTLLDFKDPPKEEGDVNSDAEFGLPSVLRVACAMVGINPNISSLASVTADDVAVPAEYVERLGKRVSFEYVPEGGGEVDYADEETFLRALRATKRTLVTQTHVPSACWGLLREVRVDIPTPPEKRGLMLIDAPGAGDSDPARDRHLVAALRNASSVICLGDSREVTGDVKRALHKSGFLQQLTIRPATRRLINAVQGDRIWGSTQTTLRRVQATLKREFGREVSLEHLERENPPRDAQIRWAVDRVINGNTAQLATTRRAELLRMLTDQDGSVREITPTARAVIAVSWKFLEFRSSWARVLDPAEVDVDAVTGHGALYAELARLKRARTLKFIRRATRRAHDALSAFCVAAEPLNALPESSDDSLRGFHDELEFCLGPDGAYAERRAYETALSFCRGVVADALGDSIDALAERANDATTFDALRRRLREAVGLGERPLEIRARDDARRFILDVTAAARDALSNVFFDASSEDSSSSRKTPSGGLRDACVVLTRRWSEALLSETEESRGETAFESLVRRTIMDLGGEETDPKRAMTRALIAMSLTKFKLGAGLKKAYHHAPESRERDATRRLWTECAKKARTELATQIKALTQGLLCAYHTNEADDAIIGDVTREGIDAFAAECVDAVAYAARGAAHAVMDVVEREAKRWFDAPSLAASEDALRACSTCVKPYVQKQIMPEFRARVAKRRMLAAIEPDVEEARALLETTSAVLGEEAKPPPTRIEKTKIIIALSDVASRPYELTKPCLSKPGGGVDSDDDVRVGLDEFPLRIYAPREARDEEPTTEAPDATTTTTTEAPDAIDEVPIDDEPMPAEVEAETETTPMKHTQTQTEPANDVVASPSTRNEIAVQTDPTELSLAVSPVRLRANEREVSESDPPESDLPQRSSSKSDVTARPPDEDETPAYVKKAPASETSTGAKKKRKMMCVTDLHANVAYASRKKRLRLSVTPSAAPMDALTAELPLETTRSHFDRPRRPRTRPPRATRDEAFDFDSDVESAEPVPRQRRTNVDAILEALPAHVRVVDPGGCDAGLSPQNVRRMLPPLDEEDENADDDGDGDEGEDGALRRPRGSPSWMQKFADPTNRRDFTRGR